MVKTDGNTLFAVAGGNAARGRRRRLEAAPARLARARAVVEPRAASARRPAARALARRLLDRAAAGAGGKDDAVPAVQVGARRGGRLQSGPAAARRHAHARRLLRRGAARRLGRPDRRLGAAAVRAPLQAAHRRLTRGDRRRRSAERRHPRALEGGELAPVLPDQARRREARQGAPARAVPARPPPDLVLGPRHAHRPHRRPGQGPAAGRLGRGDDRRPDRLRLPGEPLRRDRALGRPARPGEADGGAGRRPDRDPQVRHLEPGEDAVPRQRQGLGVPAQPVVALRVQGRPPRRQHREPGLVGRGPRDRVVPDHASPFGRRARPGRPDRRARQG